MRILILNGPNLNMLGKRQPEIYGTRSFTDYYNELQEQFTGLDYFQSNHEGDLIDRLHAASNQYEGVVFNPGGFAHTSVALADAIRSIGVPVVEVHLTNIHARENYRQHSYTAAASRGVVSGFGLEGYRMAVRFLTENTIR
ncbi:MAG: type II 3-dehydroquinate dehydratase [Bacteroidales bacterium]|nr:type II 3-dehydroquinate dehydratase [Bacteroidales bacterium]